MGPDLVVNRPSTLWLNLNVSGSFWVGETERQLRNHLRILNAGFFAPGSVAYVSLNYIQRSQEKKTRDIMTRILGTSVPNGWSVRHSTRRRFDTFRFDRTGRRNPRKKPLRSDAYFVLRRCS